MIVAAFCPVCGEVRAQTADIEPGHRPTAADFTPVDGQDQPVDGQAAVCTKCTSSLVFRRMAPPNANGHASEATRQAPGKGIVTLFALTAGEEIRDTRQLTSDVYVIFTNRRIVKIDLTELAENVNG